MFIFKKQKEGMMMPSQAGNVRGVLTMMAIHFIRPLPPSPLDLRFPFRRVVYPLAVLLLLLTLGVAGATPVYAVPSHAVIFMYHRFGEERYPTTNIRLDQFEAHLNHLDEGGYQVWPLKRIVTHLREGKTIPDRTVAITIDDAFQSVYTGAYPLLKARGWPFTVFVATDPIDKRFPSMMNWEQMREMKKGGADFANHGTTHGHLVQPDKGESRKAWRARIEGEILKAEGRLKAELGPAPKLFAYPFGEYDQRLANLVEELGVCGVWPAVWCRRFPQRPARPSPLPHGRGLRCNTQVFDEGGNPTPTRRDGRAVGPTSYWKGAPTVTTYPGKGSE